MNKVNWYWATSRDKRPRLILSCAGFNERHQLGRINAGTVLLRTRRWHRTATQTDWFLLLCLQWPEWPLLLCLKLQFGIDLVLGKEQQSFLDGEDNYKAWGQALLKGGIMLQHCYGTVTDPSQGLSWRLGAVYIDVSFPWPSFSPRLDILVYRQSNRTGLRDPCAVLVPRLTESLTISKLWRSD